MSSAEEVRAVPRTASSLLDADLAGILDAVECCVPGPGEQRTLQRVSGGLTNVNVRVDLPGRSMIARITTQDSALLAIDRDAEHANSLAAARSGAAPAVLCRDRELGVLVVQWIEGRTLCADDVRDQANLERIVQACQRLHQGPRFVGDFDMFAVQRRYLREVRERGFRLPPGYLELMPAFAAMQKALALRPEPTVPCHNDLLAENLVDDGSRIWLIDFEYAGNNEACFELGNLASESQLSLEQLGELVHRYYGRADPRLVARARLFSLASDYGWTLWASIQTASSTLDFDFWAWGMEKYERAVAQFEGLDYPRLLAEVTVDD